MANLRVSSQQTRKKILPMVMAVANAIIEDLQVISRINKSVEWKCSHWNIGHGSLAKMMILDRFTDIRIPIIHMEKRLEEVDKECFFRTWR